MDIHFANGTAISDADTKLLRFMRSEYELYDAVSVQQDSTLTLFDILLSIMMNSRLDTASKVQSIWRSKGPVEQALAAVPAHVALEDGNVPWEAVTALFDRFCEIKYAGAAVATKILHKKRPRLIPIFDSVISACISRCADLVPPARASEGERLVCGMKSFRNMLIGCVDSIRRLLLEPEVRTYSLSPVRALEVLLWIENEPNGYYAG